MFVNEVRISPLLRLPVFWVLLLLPLDRREPQNPTDSSLPRLLRWGSSQLRCPSAEQPSGISALLQAHRQGKEGQGEVWSLGAFVSGSAL